MHPIKVLVIANKWSHHISRYLMWYKRKISKFKDICPNGFYEHGIACHIHYRQKIWNIFLFGDFLHLCGVCMLFLYLKYIATGRYNFWGSKLAFNSKMKRKGSKAIISAFSSIRL